MIKVMWFLKRADGMSLEDFRAWWLSHAEDVVAAQGAHLTRYVVNVKRTEEDVLPGSPGEACDWDGVAEQWFPDEAAFAAAYDRPASATRSDTLSHTSRFSRLIVTEHTFV
jgi:hypothetical protein